MSTLLKGIILGIVMAVPVGPLSLLCIRRSLTYGALAGSATALGIALADGTYAIIAAFGLHSISDYILSYKYYFFLLGGAFLFFLGYRALMKPTLYVDAMRASEGLRQKGYFTTLLQTVALTLTNPMTLLTFIAAFSTIGIDENQSIVQAGLLSLGVFIGSLLWLMLLALAVAHYRTRVTPALYDLLQKISGALFLSYGALFCIQANWELVPNL